MKIVIGRGNKRHVFDRPVDERARKAMTDDLIRILFKQ